MEIGNPRAYKRWHRVVGSSSLPASGLTILMAAERWATVMEQRLAKGATVPQVAEETYQRVIGPNPKMALHTDWSDFLTDFLAECWKFGGALRQWYGPKK